MAELDELREQMRRIDCLFKALGFSVKEAADRWVELEKRWTETAESPGVVMKKAISNG